MSYTRINWENEPSTNTPVSATNLNIMDKGIKDIEDGTTQVADAANADNADKLDGKKWVKVGDGTVTISDASEDAIDLSSYIGNPINYEVFPNGSNQFLTKGYNSTDDSCAYIQYWTGTLGAKNAQLKIENNSGAQRDYDYLIWVWTTP